MKHVDRLLAAYTEGLLNVRDEAHVREHVAICDDCRMALSQHEQLARDLHLTLTQNPLPRREHIAQWWSSILTARPQFIEFSKPHTGFGFAALPMILAVFVFFLPVAVGLTRHSNSAASDQATYEIEPGVQVSLAPPSTLLYTTQEPPDGHSIAELDTTSAAPKSLEANSTAIPVMPAPLAP
jgi:hypothetical protein